MANPRRYVYFLQAQMLGLIKIGVADSLEKRFRALAHGSPDKLKVLGVQICSAGGALEGELHQRFANDRQHGEWFAPSKALLDHIIVYAIDAQKGLKRLQAVLDFPTMPRGRPTKEMMRQREVAGLEKWL